MLMRKLVRTAWSYKSQFLSMILMIAIGIGVFLGFHMEWHSIETDTSEFFKETNYADFRMYSDTGFTTEDIKKIQEMDGVKEATRFLSVNVGLKGIIFDVRKIKRIFAVLQCYLCKISSLLTRFFVFRHIH